MNRILALFAVLLSPLILSCGVGRSLVIPSEFAIGNEHYHVDTLKQRWGRLGDAPERTCLYFRSVRDTIVGTEKAYVYRANTHDVVVRDSSNRIIAEYCNIHPIYYSDYLLPNPDTVINQVLYALKDELSPRQCKRMTDNLTLFCVELLVGSNGLILESCQYVFMDSLRIDKEMLSLCAKLDRAVKNASVFFKGSIWMRENNIPYGSTRFSLMMTEDGLVYPSSSQRRKLTQQSRERW